MDARLESAIEKTEWHIRAALGMLQGLIDTVGRDEPLTPDQAELLARDLAAMHSDYFTRLFPEEVSKAERTIIHRLLVEAGRRDNEPRDNYGWGRAESAMHAVRNAVIEGVAAFQPAFGAPLAAIGRGAWTPNSVARHYPDCREQLLRLGKLDCEMLRVKCSHQFELAKQIAAERDRQPPAPSSPAPTPPPPSTNSTEDSKPNFPLDIALQVSKLVASHDSDRRWFGEQIRIHCTEAWERRQKCTADRHEDFAYRLPAAVDDDSRRSEVRKLLADFQQTGHEAAVKNITKEENVDVVTITVTRRDQHVPDPKIEGPEPFHLGPVPSLAGKYAVMAAIHDYYLPDVQERSGWEVPRISGASNLKEEQPCHHWAGEYAPIEALIVPELNEEKHAGFLRKWLADVRADLERTVVQVAVTDANLETDANMPEPPDAGNGAEHGPMLQPRSADLHAVNAAESPPRQQTEELAVATPQTDKKGDKRTNRSKKRRELNIEAVDCIRRFKEQRKLDPTVRMKHVVEQYVEELKDSKPRLSAKGIMRRLNDHPEQWKPT